MHKVVNAIAALMLFGVTQAMAAPSAEERTWSLGCDERDPYLSFGNQEMGETTVITIAGIPRN